MIRLSRQAIQKTPTFKNADQQAWATQSLKSPAAKSEETRREKLKRNPWKRGEVKPNIFTKGQGGRVKSRHSGGYGTTESIKQELVDDQTAFEFRRDEARPDYVDFYSEQWIRDYGGHEHIQAKLVKSRISPGNVRKLFPVNMLDTLQPVNPMDEKEIHVDGSKWVEVPQNSRFRSTKGMHMGRGLVAQQWANNLIIGGGVTGQALMYAQEYYASEYAAIAAGMYNVNEGKKGGWAQDFAQTIFRNTRNEVGRAHNLLVERDPNFTEAYSAHALGIQKFAFTNPQLVKMAIEAKDFIKKLKFHLAILGDDAPDVHFEPVGSLWIARKSDGSEQKQKLIDAYNVARDSHTKYKEIGTFTAMLLGPDRLKTMFPWMNCDDVELAVYGLEHEGTYNYQALHRYLIHKNRQYGNKYMTGEFVGVRKIHALDAYHTSNPVMSNFQYGGGVAKEKMRMQDAPYTIGYETGDGEYGGLDREFGPNSAIKTAFFKVPNNKEPVEIRFAEMILCCGRWTNEACQRIGIGDPEAQNEYLRRAIPIVGRKRYTYIINAKNAGPVLDMPYIIDEESKLTVRRHGLSGDYIVTLWPQKDQGDLEPQDYDLAGDDKFFWERVYPELKHRMPLLDKDNFEYKGGWGHMIDFNKFDGAPLLGPHPYHRNVHILSGFGGLGSSLNVGAAMWMGRFLWERAHSVEGNILQHFYSERDELDWRTTLGIDRVIEYNRRSAELASV